MSSLEERLRIIDKEREKIHEHIRKARKDRDETVSKAEKERREALQQLDSKLQYSKSQLQPSSAPEHLVSNEVDDEPPSELCCCITGDLMEDPVTAMDGHTYERSAIEAWFARFDNSQSPTSPLTNEALPSRRLIPSHNIRSQCKTWREKLGKETELVPDPLAGLSTSGRKQSNSSTQGGQQQQRASRNNISSSDHSGNRNRRSNSQRRPANSNGRNGSSSNTPNRGDRPVPTRTGSGRMFSSAHPPGNGRNAQSRSRTLERSNSRRLST